MNKTLLGQEGEDFHSFKLGTTDMQSAWALSSWCWPEVSTHLEDRAPDLALSLVDIFHEMGLCGIL